MAKTNTEKPMTIAEKKQTQVKNAKQPELAKPVVTSKKQEKEDSVINKTSQLSDSEQTKSSIKEEEKAKQPIQKKPKTKKTEAVVVGKNLHISTKYSISICKFIKNKKIENVIKELQEVLIKKRSVPMKGEIPHRKGPGKIASGSGRYPKRATEHFIRLLKSLQANANYNEIENPVIFEAVANIGERPYGRFGTVKRKRTHLIIKARNKKINKEKKNEK